MNLRPHCSAGVVACTFGEQEQTSTIDKSLEYEPSVKNRQNENIVAYNDGMWRWLQNRDMFINFCIYNNLATGGALFLYKSSIKASAEHEAQNLRDHSKQYRESNQA